MKRLRNNQVNIVSIVKSADFVDVPSYTVQMKSTFDDSRVHYFSTTAIWNSESDFIRVVIDLVANDIDAGEYLVSVKPTVIGSVSTIFFVADVWDKNRNSKTNQVDDVYNNSVVIPQ